MKHQSWAILPIKYLTKYGSHYLPPRESEISGNMKKDNFVQLVFRSNNGTNSCISVEKLWCRITGFEEGLYYGKLMDQPVLIDGLERGDFIRFSHDYVVGINQRMGEAG